MPTVKAVLNGFIEYPNENYLRFTYSAVLYDATGYKATISADVYFDFATSQVNIRNSIRNSMIAEANKLGYSLQSNDILYPLQP